MTAPLLATRDALAEWLASELPGWAVVKDCTPDQIGWSAREGYLLNARRRADALLASGVVRDPATLAEDDGLLWQVAQNDYDMHAGEGAGDFDDDWVTQAEQTLRALAAALTEDG